MDFIIKLAGSLEEMNIKCPICNSKKVVIARNGSGYFEVSKCIKCNYEPHKNKYS